MFAQIDAAWWAIAVLGVFAIALVAALVALQRRLDAAQAEVEALSEQFAALREQSQRDLLAMGQRVIEADKALRRFGERLEAVADKPAAPTQYGQLEALLSGAGLREDSKMSSAEEQLLSLLRKAAGNS